MHAEDEDVYSNPNAATRDINDILEKCKKDYEDYESYEYYMKASNKWKKGKHLQLDEHTMFENNNYEEPPEIPRPSPLLIIDDMSHSDIYSTSRHNPFINLCLRHRYINHGKGITIFLACQTFKSRIALALRQNVQQYFLWPTRDVTQVEAVYHEVGNLTDYESFKALYDQATQDSHDFLVIDMNAPHPSLQFRRNFNIILKHK